MSTITQGSLVTVIDKGLTYTGYEELFDHAQKLLEVDIKHAHALCPNNGETYIVLAVVKHFNTDVPIALIHNDNQYAYLVEVKGLKLK